MFYIIDSTCSRSALDPRTTPALPKSLAKAGCKKGCMRCPAGLTCVGSDRLEVPLFGVPRRIAKESSWNVCRGPGECVGLWGRESGGLARPLPRLKMRLREGCASRAECVRMGVAGEPAAMAAVLRDELQHLTLPAEGKY